MYKITTIKRLMWAFLFVIPGTAWMAQQPVKDLLQSVDDLPGYCGAITDTLLKQGDVAVKYLAPGGYTVKPWKDEDPALVKYKVIPWARLSECKICWAMSKYAREILKKDVPSIDWFQDKENMTWDEPGYRLRLLSSEKPCGDLKSVYAQVIEDLQSGWVLTNTIDPKIKLAKNENDWLLFIKENANKEYDEDLTGFLIRELASRFNLPSGGHEKAIISCSNAWLTDAPHENGPYEHLSNKVYLWIKKDSVKKVQNIFKFKFIDKPGL